MSATPLAHGGSKQFAESGHTARSNCTAAFDAQRQWTLIINGNVCTPIFRQDGTLDDVSLYPGCQGFRVLSKSSSCEDLYLWDGDVASGCSQSGWHFRRGEISSYELRHGETLHAIFDSNEFGPTKLRRALKKEVEDAVASAWLPSGWCEANGHLLVQVDDLELTLNPVSGGCWYSLTYRRLAASGQDRPVTAVLVLSDDHRKRCLRSKYDVHASSLCFIAQTVIPKR